MERKIIFATGNAHKLEELREITKIYTKSSSPQPARLARRKPTRCSAVYNATQDFRSRLRLYRENLSDTKNENFITFSLPVPPFDPIENGTTFEENSLIKAKAVLPQKGFFILADDSGLCVDALDGRPGLHSARYAPTQDEKIEKLLDEMSDKTDRRAKFVCAMTLLNDKGEIIFKTTGKCKGEIAKERKGTNGFGFDPVFIPDVGQDAQEIKTLAQMPSDLKNQISHRANALKSVIDYLQNA